MEFENKKEESTLDSKVPYPFTEENWKALKKGSEDKVSAGKQGDCS